MTKMIEPSFQHLGGPMVGRYGLSVRHLEIFWGVMRTGTQSGAAELLGISQPAISKMLKYVEQRTGLTLFYRSRGRLMPTNEANIFFRSIEEIFESVSKTETLLDDLQHRAAGEVSIAFSGGLGTGAVAAFLADFRRAHPQSRLRVKLLQPPVIAERTIRQEIDLGVYHGPMGDLSVSSILLADHAVVCVLPKDHRLSVHSVVTPEMLRDEHILSGAYTGPVTWMHQLRETFESRGITYRPSIECMHSQHVYEMVHHKLGVGLVPPVPIGDTLGLDIVIRELRPRVGTPLFAIMPAGRPPAQATTSIITSIQRVLARQRAKVS